MLLVGSHLFQFAGTTNPSCEAYLVGVIKFLIMAAGGGAGCDTAKHHALRVKVVQHPQEMTKLGLIVTAFVRDPDESSTVDGDFAGTVDRRTRKE